MFVCVHLLYLPEDRLPLVVPPCLASPVSPIQDRESGLDVGVVQTPHFPLYQTNIRSSSMVSRQETISGVCYVCGFPFYIDFLPNPVLSKWHPNVSPVHTDSPGYMMTGVMKSKLLL